MDNQRNLILAVVLSLVLLLGWDFAMNRLYPQPEGQQAVAEQSAVDAPVGEAPAVTRTREGGLNDPADVALEKKDLDVELRTAARVRIDAPEVAGSINPVGARIDDISLKSHRQTVDKDSGPVRLFSPAGTPAQQFAQFGWVGEGIRLPDARTVWQASGGPLAPGTPVTLQWDNGEGQLFTIELSIDERYMITAEQTLANTGTGAVIAQPYAFINRTSRTASTDTWNVHAGPIGEFGGSVSFDNDYDDIAETGRVRPEGAPGWLGFTDIYWLSALVPQSDAAAEADFRALDSEHFRADLIYDPVTVAAGKQVTRTTRLFAGAKESDVLDAYEEQGVEKFGLSIDWGWFRWFEKPIFWLLKTLYDAVGNFGVADFVKSGAGQLTLAADADFLGLTTIAEGTLQLGNGGTTGALQGDIVNNGELRISRSGDILFTSLVSGTGSLVHDGPGNLQVVASNTFTGTTTINAGSPAVLEATNSARSE